MDSTLLRTFAAWSFHPCCGHAYPFRRKTRDDLVLLSRRLSTNLILYLTRVMGQESGHAALQVSLFEGTCYLTPLLGAWLADSRWGRYKTIMVFSIIYFLVRVVAWLGGPVVQEQDEERATDHLLVQRRVKRPSGV